MTDQLFDRLSPVRRRQQMLFMGKAVAAGLLIGSVAAVGYAAARLAGVSLSAWGVVALPAAGAAAGLLVGAIRRRSWLAAAVAIDAHYGLKDRAESALLFSKQPEPGELHRLQLADCLDHLRQVDPKAVAPWSTPRSVLASVAVMVIAAVLVMLPSQNDPLQASVPPPAPEAIVAEAERLEEQMLEELKELADEHQDKELEELAAELNELVEAMKQPGVDDREALAKLSEMQAAIAEAQAEYNVEAVDAQLQKLAEALSPAAATQATSEALKAGEYAKAADLLEKLDPTQLSNRERQAVAENLKKCAGKMQQAGNKKLSQAASQMCEGMKNNNASQCQAGACKMAGMCRQQAGRKSISQCLGMKLSLLSECKGNCAGACNSKKNGGNKVARSNSSSTNWGLGASGQALTDEATSIETQRDRKEISGTHGDGPSEKAVFQSGPEQQMASREYQKKYEEYRKQTEAVLESEALPLGHRRTIRQYFESIRPTSDEAAAVDAVE